MKSSTKRRQSTARATSPPSYTKLTNQLLAWYGENHRKLPWRAAPGKNQDPYVVWLSEIMLQQTTVTAVIPYFHKFLRQWPSVKALASAPLENVMSAWAGLGYYSRARNLHACANAVVTQHGGRFPSEERELLALPGIGPYTAAAISAIAFGNKAAPVDGNIERVLSRVWAITTPLPQSKPEIRKIATAMAPNNRSGDLAQAMMDLGSEICTPKAPNCPKCPWQKSCAAHQRGIAANLPARAASKPRPKRFAATFVAVTPAGEILLRKRPAKGLLASMHETPSTDFETAPLKSSAKRAPIAGQFVQIRTPVVHVFTHFELEMTVFVATVTRPQPLAAGFFWAPLASLDSHALPSLFRKVIAAALSHQEIRPAKRAPKK